MSAPEAVSGLSPALFVENLHAAYLRKEILRGTTLAARPGEVVCLVGANGAGKSTLLRVVAGLLPVRAGRVFLFGTEMTSLSSRERVVRGLGYLLQDGAVFPMLTTRENLAVAAAPGNGRAIATVIDEALGAFPSLSPYLTRRAGLLSGGERRILSIAMILASRPRALLLDEPSAGLAPALAGPALDRLLGYARSVSAPCLLVEQNLRLGIERSDKIYLMNDGGAHEVPMAEARSDAGLLARLMFPRRDRESTSGGFA